MMAAASIKSRLACPSPQPTEQGRALYGVAGWAYEDWNGIVYPKPRPKGFSPLEYLIKYFDVLEINSSFYAIPAPHIVERWANAAIKKFGFEFTMKLWQGFTHERQKMDEGNVQSFIAAAKPLQQAGVLGSILIQFPWSFKPEKSNIDYLNALLDRFSQFPLTVEIRHDAWVAESDAHDITDILKPRGVAFCNIDQPRLHDCIGLTQLITAPHAYLRVHGRNYEHWFQQDADRNARYDYLYSLPEVVELADTVKDLKSQATKVYVITNNHWRGQAAANALQIKAEVEQAIIEAPAELCKNYNLGPNVIPSIEDTKQMELFQ